MNCYGTKKFHPWTHKEPGFEQIIHDPLVEIPRPTPIHMKDTLILVCIKTHKEPGFEQIIHDPLVEIPRPTPIHMKDTLILVCKSIHTA